MNPLFKKIFFACIATFISFCSFAVDLTPLSSIVVGYQNWNAKYTAEFTEQEDIIENIKNVELDTNGDQVIFLQFNHSIPLLPNIQIENTNLKNGTDAFNSTDLKFLRDEFAEDSNNINTSFDINITDYVAFWGITYINVGIAVRQINFLTNVTATDIENLVQSEESDFSIISLFAQTQFNLPMTKIFATAKTFYADGSIRDIRAGIGYRFKTYFFSWELEVGYRDAVFVLNESVTGINNFNFNYAVSGSYLGFKATF